MFSVLFLSYLHYVICHISFPFVFPPVPPLSVLISIVRYLISLLLVAKKVLWGWAETKWMETNLWDAFGSEMSPLTLQSNLGSNLIRVKLICIGYQTWKNMWKCSERFWIFEFFSWSFMNAPVWILSAPFTRKLIVYSTKLRIRTFSVSWKFWKNSTENIGLTPPVGAWAPQTRNHI